MLHDHVIGAKLLLAESVAERAAYGQKSYFSLLIWISTWSWLQFFLNWIQKRKTHIYGLKSAEMLALTVFDITSSLNNAL